MLGAPIRTILKRHEPDLLDLPEELVEVACAAHWDYGKYPGQYTWDELVAKGDRRVPLFRKEMQAALSALIEANMVIWNIPEKQPSGMPQGYTFDTTTCPDCRQPVKGNWLIRHRRSGCVKGAFREEAT